MYESTIKRNHYQFQMFFDYFVESLEHSFDCIWFDRDQGVMHFCLVLLDLTLSLSFFHFSLNYLFIKLNHCSTGAKSR